MQMRMRDKFVRTMRQQTPLVLGQKGLGADMVSTASPAFMVFLDLTVLIPLAAVMFVPLLLTLLELNRWGYLDQKVTQVCHFYLPEGSIWSISHSYS